MKRALILWAAALAVACVRPGESPACSPTRLAAIEAAYVDEVLEACRGESFDGCEARLAVEERYAALREEWARCR